MCYVLKINAVSREAFQEACSVRAIENFNMHIDVNREGRNKRVNTTNQNEMQ